MGKDVNECETETSESVTKAVALELNIGTSLAIHIKQGRGYKQGPKEKKVTL